MHMVVQKVLMELRKRRPIILRTMNIRRAYSTQGDETHPVQYVVEGVDRGFIVRVHDRVAGGFGDEMHTRFWRGGAVDLVIGSWVTRTVFHVRRAIGVAMA